MGCSLCSLQSAERPSRLRSLGNAYEYAFCRQKERCLVQPSRREHKETIQSTSRPSTAMAQQGHRGVKTLYTHDAARDGDQVLCLAHPSCAVPAIAPRTSGDWAKQKAIRPASAMALA